LAGPGRVAVWRSPGKDGFELVTALGRPARMGSLVADLYPGPVSRFDPGNVAIVDRAFGTLASVTDVALFGGANTLAVEAAPGVWEVLQFGVAELIEPGRYRLFRLLRGQRGTENAIGAPAPAGARVVVLEETLTPLPVAVAALGLEANWRIGPASKPVSDRSYRAMSFTPEGVGLRPFSVGHVEQAAGRLDQKHRMVDVADADGLWLRGRPIIDCAQPVGCRGPDNLEAGRVLHERDAV
jgi:hypothetical protein